MAAIKNTLIEDTLIEDTLIEDSYSLSPLQQGMLFHTLREKGVGMYISQAVSRYENLDCRALQQAWQLVIDRHAILRTSFHWDDPENPFQVVHRQVAVPFYTEDWRGLSPSEQNFRLRTLQQKEREQGFDLTQPAQIRITVIQVTRTRWLCVNSHHHIILDGWSGAILAGEVGRAYQAYKSGRTPVFDTPIPFGNYIRWIKTQNIREANDFWRNHLVSILLPTPLPAEREMGAYSRTRMHVASWQIRLDGPEAEQVSHFARSCKVTLNTVIQSVWPILLSRYSGLKSVLFGVVVSGRPPELAGVESIVGMFLNTVPFCVSIEDELGVGEWLQKIHLQRTRMQRYEHTSLMVIQQLSGIPGGMPLFNSIVARKDVAQAGSGAGQRSKVSRTSKSEQATFQQNYPILLNITASDGIELKITYDARKFRAIDIARILEQLRHLLMGLCQAPDQKLGDVGLASEQEIHRLCHEWNDTSVNIEHTRRLDEVIAENAQARPNQVAARYGEQQITFLELERQIRRTAGYLHQCGLGARDLITVALKDPLQHITAVSAVFRINARCIPLDGSNVTLLWDQKIRHDCRGLITDEKHQEFDKKDLIIIDIDSISDRGPLPEIVLPDVADNRHDSGEVALVLQLQAENPCEVSHRFLATRFIGHSVTGHSLAFTAGTELAIWSPGDSISFFSELYACWQGYGSVTCIENPTDGNIAQFCAGLGASSISRISITPSLLSQILQNTALTKQVAAVQTWICTGEPLWPELGEVFHERLPESRLINVFTTSRLGPCMAWEVPKTGLVFEGMRLGFPLANVRAYVASEAGNLAPVGVAGKLLLAVDDATSRAVNGPHEKPAILPASEQIFPTGILVRRWNDGTVEYLGRVDPHNSCNVGDVSGLTARMRVARALQKEAMVGAADFLFCGSDMRIACIGTTQQNLSLADLHKRLCRLVSKIFAPTHYLVLSELPLDRSGRIDREKLLSMQEQAVEATGFTEVIKKPKSEIERIIAQVWMEILRIDKISTDDNFFELGGHSLAATKATARLTQILQSDIHLKGIFEAPTVSSFADWIQSERHQEELPFAISVTDRGKDAPLTFTQQQLWVLGQLFPQLPMYTIPSNAIFTGKMDIDALARALEDIVERHEILRTIFVFHNGEPRQVVLPALADLHLDVIDLTHLPEKERMEEARRQGAQLGKKTWDFEHGPLIRPQLVKLGEDHYLLNTAFHHIIADGPSVGVFMADLGALYDARVKGRAPKLPQMPLQFADFAIWERENVKGDLFKRQLAYWRKTIDGATLLEIPTDFPRPPVHGFLGKKIKFEIKPETGSRLHRIGQEQGATMFMCLLAVYQLLLHKYSGQDDIVIGSAMTNRIRVELERLIGLFVNTVPLRTDFSGDPTFRDILNRVRDCCLGAYANMDLPFEETIAQIQPHRDLSRQGSPLFQFMLIHQPAGPGRKEPQNNVNGPSLRPGDPHNDTGYANFDILLSTRDTREGLIKITMVYDTELFRRETIDRMIDHLQIIVKSVTCSPDTPISQLDMSGPAERQEILVQWNGEDIAQETRLVHQLITDNAQRFPDHAAVCYGSKSMTYGELDQRSNQVGALLVKAGVGPESMVAICLPKSDDLIVGIVAILKAGGAFVPVDACYPADRIKHILTDTDCKILVSNATLGPDIQQHKTDLVLIDIASLAIDAQPDSAPEVAVSPENLAYVIYTSGSTGLPKGVMVEHRNLVHIITSQIRVFKITRASRVLQMLSISFDAATGEIFRTLIAGGTLYMADPDDLLPGPDLVRILKENRITVVAMSPTALGAMPDCSEELPDLQTITVGGEACPQQVAERWGHGRRMLNAYGPTETTIGATLAVNWDFKGKPPLGRPLPGVKVYVLDKNNNIAPVGTPGELLIGGAGVTRGYLNRPELTQKSFIANPFSGIPGDRVYRTGDLVRWLSTGMLDFLGRIDQQVKIRGFRIELGEIETALARHPDIDHCTVNVHESKAVKRLVAYTVSSRGTQIDAMKLRAFLKQKLPEYMIPAFFMPVDKIPTTSSGKVDRRALPEPNLGELISGNKEYTAPDNVLEETLVKLWCEVLGIEKIGVLDNFFEIGGDSISAIRVAARANTLGVTFTPKDIFVNQTIRELSEYLHNIDE